MIVLPFHEEGYPVDFDFFPEAGITSVRQRFKVFNWWGCFPLSWAHSIDQLNCLDKRGSVGFGTVNLSISPTNTWQKVVSWASLSSPILLANHFVTK